MNQVSLRRIWLARGIAATADLLQIVAFPYFFEGLLSPLNVILDLIVAGVLVLLVGWHLAFLPSFIVEQIPFADLAPTWSIAVLMATRKPGRKQAIAGPPSA